ncbi:polysaccharide deacetylase family protein [Cellvibrio japonicus]|uniref:Polysaccharide deacetylase n=1 Tax=Cellvibrio japonicus (strain Ueda107) TaxID=498211 RepID=B3PCH2_CELJU|nr:polysaccharide deacetylase family protein [Cellvibrio japonicus]ACE86010.1 polysaccharide deacetylase [Cellvibrio japonicus Ueda107]QEI11876.1 polysaccharide deacetylase family protein [Cellvibrio japonicus]QEI15450.1 polysaccharide deacetylase family protein [Cellvibrio japonicus]QEI19029.1 polysaccharide deacetylase family protein [Cellvibrio japonicus]
MIKPLCNLLFGFGLMSLGTHALAADTPFTWPKGAKAAVNLAYDDALDSQLDHAIPDLNKYGLKGTFYLSVASPSLQTRLEDWRTAAKQGHELGNHSIFHQCAKSSPGREWVSVDRDLDKVSVVQMQDQVKVANSFLHAIDGKTERTYTPPCIDLNAGGSNYIDGLKSEFVAIKAKSGGVTPDMETLDPYAVSVDFPTNVTGEQLIAVVKEAAAKGTMANFTFHGVGGDHLSVSREAHEQLLKYLAENKDIYWTDTFVNIMKYVKAQR